MPANLEFPVRKLERIVDELTQETRHDAAYFANNILSNVFLLSSSGKRGITRKVPVASISQDLNKLTGDVWIDRTTGRKRVRQLRVKHVLAMKALRARKQKLTWPLINVTARKLLGRRRSSSGYLRSGFLYAGLQLRENALRVKSGTMRHERSITSLEQVSSGNRRLSEAQPANFGNEVEAQADNLVATLIDKRPLDEANFIFTNGRPSLLMSFGDESLALSADEQLEREEKSLAKIQERAVQKRLDRIK